MGRQADGDRHQTAVFVPPDTLKVHRLPGDHRPKHLGELMLAVGGDDQRLEGLPDGFSSAIAKELLGAPVPALHHAVRRHAQDGINRTLHNGGQMFCLAAGQ